MGYLENEQSLQVLAGALDDILTEMYGKRIGFALFTFHFDENEVGDWISNGERDDMINFMREVADRLEKRQYIGNVKGSA